MVYKSQRNIYHLAHPHFVKHRSTNHVRTPILSHVHGYLGEMNNKGTHKLGDLATEGIDM